eukprot:scaffold13412_cov47-Attheya_sp.AAC.2
MSEAAASDSQNGVTIGVRMSTAARFDIRVESLDQTILSVKQVIATKEESGKCPVERQRLICKGRILSDDSRTLRDYGLVEGSLPATLHLVKGSAAPSSNTPSSSSSTSTPTPAPTATTTTPNPFGGATGTGGGNNGMGNMMQQMMQMQQQPGGGAPDMAQMQQQMMQNPEMMQEMMSSPMMQSMMDNPQLMQNLVQNNPQMQQLLQQNPELRHVLEDPEMMRRSMQMMRDPSLQQQMMRNQDLAMGQIENMPGGFNALRRMYQDVQEPMMDAMIQPETNTSNTANNSAASRGGSMPNPWGSPTPTTNTPSAPQSNPFTGAGAGAGGGGALGNNNMPTNPWGGAGVPDMNNPFATSGGVPTQANLDQTIEMLENPMVANMMNQMFSDPQQMQSMMDSNPMLRQMRDSNPQMAQMLSNPDSLRTMMNPQNLRAMSQLQGAMQQMGGGNGVPGMMPPMMPPNPAGTAPAPPAGGLDFSSVLNQFQSTNIGMGSVGGTTRAPAGFGAMPTALPPPEQRFRHQLQSLRDMGFDDEAENIRALTMNHGNVNRAIETLFEGPPAPAPTPAAAPAPAPTDNSNNNDGSPDDGSPDDSPPADKKND